MLKGLKKFQGTIDILNVIPGNAGRYILNINIFISKSMHCYKEN